MITGHAFSGIRAEISDVHAMTHGRFGSGAIARLEQFWIIFTDKLGRHLRVNLWIMPRGEGCLGASLQRMHDEGCRQIRPTNAADATR